MSYRATKTEVNEVFSLFCKAIGKRVAASYNDTGAWTLDYAREYGGYAICQIINDRGAKETPLGDQRYPATELVERMRFALRWLEQSSDPRMRSMNSLEDASNPTGQLNHVGERESPRIVIEMEGGLIHDIIANVKTEALVLDADTEGGDADRIKEITKWDGNREEVYSRGIEEVEVFPEYVGFYFSQFSQKE